MMIPFRTQYPNYWQVSHCHGGLSVKAAQACDPCKKQKRRCDKSLPVCSLCGRTGRTCDYSDKPIAPTAAEFATFQARLTELEDRLSSTSETPDSLLATASASVASLATDSGRPTSSSRASTSFPSALFLDIDCYRWAKMQLPKPHHPHVLTILGQQNTVLETSAAYFDTIHRWMPIVSKRRVELGISLQSGGPDLAILFLAMKLNISRIVGSTECSSLYSMAKGFVATLEAAATLIYPAAWMTVGACARHADIFGLSAGGDTMKIMSRFTTWKEVEERRRVWWAIYILDRVISLGSRRRFSFHEPADNDILPVDDVALDSGDVVHILNHPVSTPFSVTKSPFAHLCQSAMFIRFIRPHIYALSAAEEMPSSYSEGYLALLGPCCLTWSALFLLLENYCCPERLGDETIYMPAGGAKDLGELTMQVQASLMLRNISDQVHEVAMKIMGIAALGPQGNDQLGKVGTLSLNALYCAMTMFLWISHEGGGDGPAKASLVDIERCLQTLGKRWRLASEYLTLGEVYRNIPDTMIP